MTSALTAQNLLDLRAGGHKTKAWLAVYTPVAIGTALINQTVFSNPIAQLTIDNVSANWTTKVKKGMTVWIGTTSGARDVGVFRIRKTPTTTILYLSEFSNGDSGALANSTLQPLANNYFITVLNHYGVHPVMSRIVFSGGAATFYKDYDTAYADYNEVSKTPVQVNIGDHYAGFVDTGTNKVTVSYAVTVKAFGSGVTASSYSWAVDDGTITVGSASTSSITATFPKGQRWVTCTVTLSNSTTVTVQRAVFAYNTTDTLPYEIEITSDNRTLRGRTVNFNLPETTIAGSNIDDGMLGLIFEESSWAGNSITTAITKFTGFIRRANNNSTALGQMGQGDYSLESPLLLYEQFPFVSQELAYAASPATWAEVDSTLNHTEYYAFYLLYWHTTLCNLFDFFPNANYNSYKFQAFSSTGGNLVRALEENLQRLNLNIGQTSGGGIYIYRDPAYMTSTERSALATRITLNENDLTALSFEQNIRAQASQVQAYGANWQAGTVTAYLSYGMGTSRGYGGIEESLEGQLLSTTDPQAELNLRASNHFAKLNNPRPRITAELIGNYDVFDLPDLGKIGMNIPAAYSPSGLAYTADCYVTEISAAWQPNGGKLVTAVLTEITSGLNAPAQSMPVIVGNDYPPYEIPTVPYDPGTGGVVIPYDPYVPPIDIFGDDDPTENPDDEDVAGTRVLFAWAGSKIARMYPDQDAQWEVIWEQEGADGQIVDVLVDASSTLLTVDPTSGTLDLFISQHDTTAGGASEDGIYQLTDVLAPLPITGAQVNTQPMTQLRQSFHAVRQYTGKYWSRMVTYYNHSGVDSTTTIPANSSSTVLFDQGSGAGVQSLLIAQGDMQYDGTAGHRVDGAYYTTDNWATYTRWNTFQFDNEYVRASNIEYNTDHTYAWNFYQINNDDFIVGYKSPSGTYTGSGSITLNIYFSPSYGSTTSPIYTTTDDFTTTFTSGSGTDLDGSVEPDSCADVSDHFELGISGALNRLRYTDDLGANVDSVVIEDIAMFSTDQHFSPCLVRIPYRKIAAGRALNSDPTALHFIYGTNGGLGGNYLYRVIFNSTTNNATETNITPVISTVSYIPCGRNSVETSGHDSLELYGWFEKETGDGGSVLLYSDDGGDSYSLISGIAGGNFVQWETSTSCWFAGTDYNDSTGCGVLNTPDGVTFYDFTANWQEAVGTFPIRGVRIVRF